MGIFNFTPSSLASPIIKNAAGAASTALLRHFMYKHNVNVPLIYGGIYNRVTDTLIPILVPEEISRSHSANLEELTAESRSVTQPYYTGGTSPTRSFTVYLNDDFYNLVLQKGFLNVGSKIEYLTKATTAYRGSTISEVLSALRALTYPEYERGVARPPEVIVFLGESAKFIGRCTSVSDTLQGVTGLNDDFRFSHRIATVSLEFTVLKEVRTSNRSNVPSASDIQRDGGGYFGL